MRYFKIHTCYKEDLRNLQRVFVGTLNNHLTEHLGSENQRHSKIKKNFVPFLKGLIDQNIFRFSLSDTTQLKKGGRFVLPTNCNFKVQPERYFNKLVHR